MGSQVLDHKRAKANFLIPADEVVIIGLDTDDGPEHPAWQERAKLPVDPLLVADLRIRGMLQAVGVKKVKGDDGEVHVICVWGRQRVKAAREAGILVKCELVKLDDAGMALTAMSENNHRRDNGPIQNAEEAHRAINVFSTPIAEVAQAQHASIQTVQGWLKWFDLVTDVQKAVKDELISFTAAILLSSLPRGEQLVELGRLLGAGKVPTIADVKARVKKDQPKCPPKKKLRKMLDWDMMPKGFLDGVRYCLGLIDDKEAGLEEHWEAEAAEEADDD